jgi:hypothetical protein
LPCGRRWLRREQRLLQGWWLRLLLLLRQRRRLEEHERDVLLAHLAPAQLRVEARLLPLRAREEHLR